MLIKKHIGKIILITLAIITISLASKGISNYINHSGLKDFILSTGMFGPIVFIFLAALSNVLPPIPALPFWYTSITVFGMPWGPVIMYLANVLGNVTNYMIARQWGRGAITKLAGKGNLEKIETFAAIKKTKYFFPLRIFGGISTDYISYAAGLAKMNFLSYLWTTAVGLIPMMYLGFLFINYIIKGGSPAKILVVYLINYIMTLTFVPLIIFRSTKKYQRKSLRSFAKSF